MGEVVQNVLAVISLVDTVICRAAAAIGLWNSVAADRICYARHGRSHLPRDTAIRPSRNHLPSDSRHLTMRTSQQRAGVAATLRFNIIRQRNASVLPSIYFISAAMRPIWP